MPKKTLGFCGTICALCAATFAHAATSCDPGYYLENGTCHDCGDGYYCTGGTAPRVDCHTTLPEVANPPKYIAIFSLSNGDWGDYLHATKATDCVCNWQYEDETRTLYYYEESCIYGPRGNEYTRYQWCRTGYYATNPLTWGEWYTACAPCTNGPAHSHYTSYSTPSEMYVVESNCPWECDDGYGRVGDTCEPLCAAGVTHLRAGDATAPLFPVRRTTPSLVVQTAGGVCYGNLTVGQGAGINITINGTTYHLGN